jgi:hypothetical protein
VLRDVTVLGPEPQPFTVGTGLVGAGNSCPPRTIQRQRGLVEASDSGVFRAYRAGVGHVWHQGIGRNLTEQARLEVLQGLAQFGLSVHHERPIRCDRFADGLAAQDKQLQGRTSRVLLVVAADLEPVAPRRPPG